MPVPKNTTAPADKAEVMKNLTDAVNELEGASEVSNTHELVSNVAPEPHDFEVRRAALELAISAREADPVRAARDYYGFLAGDKPEETA